MHNTNNSGTTRRVRRTLGFSGFLVVQTFNCQVVIYGAGKIGNEFLNFLEMSNYERKKISFAVTNMQGNKTFISNVPVYPIEYYEKKSEKVTIVLAMKEQIQFEIAQDLKKRGFTKILSLDNTIRKYINRFGHL